MHAAGMGHGAMVHGPRVHGGGGPGVDGKRGPRPPLHPEKLARFVDPLSTCRPS